MALINLRNGKTIEVDLMWYLSLSDEELQDLEALNVGFEIENPFHGSCIRGKGAREVEEEDAETEEVRPVDENEDLDLIEPDDI